MTTLKKLLWILFGIIAVIAVIIGLGLIFTKRKVPTQAIQDIIEGTKQKLDSVEINAQIKRAEAKHQEDAIVAELREIKEIKDSRKRRERLAEML